MLFLTYTSCIVFAGQSLCVFSILGSVFKFLALVSFLVIFAIVRFGGIGARCSFAVVFLF